MKKEKPVKISFLSENKYVLLLLLLAAILLFYPAFRFNLPVVQTDGASQYIYAKTLADNNFNFNLENPKYNQYSSVEKKISDYPPLMPALMAVFITVFGHDTALINGVFGGIFLLFALLFVYLLAKELTNKPVAIIALLFAVLNVRMYFTLFVGMLSSTIAFAFFFPALYFALLFFKNQLNKKIDWSNLLLALFFTFLVMLTYPIFAIYLLFLQFAVWLGIAFQEKFSFSLPEIKLSIKKPVLGDLRNLLYFIVPALLLLVYVLIRFILNSSVHGSWVSQWISGLLSQCSGYLCVWSHFLIVDGFLFILFALLGFFYLLYRQKFTIVFLVLASWFIVVFKNYFVAGDPVILIYLTRFYPLFFVILAIPAALFIYSAIENKQFRKVAISLLILCLLIQVIALVFFFSKVSPAISSNEHSAAVFLSNYKNADILFIDNKAEAADFRAFKWVVVYSRAENFNVVHSLPDDFSKYDIIFISDSNSFDLKMLQGYSPAFSSGPVVIYQKFA